MEQDTTIRVYSADRDWLQARARASGFERGRLPTMADIVRELRIFVEQAEAAGEA